MLRTGVNVAVDVTTTFGSIGHIARRHHAQLRKQHAQPATVRRFQ